VNYYRPPRDLWTVCTPYTTTSSPQYSRSISISISISIYLHLQPSVDLPPTFSYVFRALFTSGPRVNTSLAHRALFSSSHMNPSPSPQPARQSSSIFFSTRCNHRGPFPKKDRARNDPSDTHADARRPLHGKHPPENAFRDTGSTVSGLGGTEVDGAAVLHAAPAWQAPPCLNITPV
jgi:hypothetical protein